MDDGLRGEIFAAWATGKTAKIWNGVEMRWEVITPDTIKIRAGDEWITLREAIERWAATQESGESDD